MFKRQRNRPPHQLTGRNCKATYVDVAMDTCGQRRSEQHLASVSLGLELRSGRELSLSLVTHHIPPLILCWWKDYWI